MSDVIGYKAFNLDMSCTRGKGKFQYEVGRMYTMDEDVMSGRNGFHFCLSRNDCYHFYPRNNSILCQIRALGTIEGDSLRYTTDKILIEKVIERNGVEVNGQSEDV